MTIENNRLRTEFLNTEVITRDTGKRLGLVRELLVDIDRREVVALGLRDNRLALSGLARYMYLDKVTQTGDVILVEDEDVIEEVDVEAYSQLVNSEVITETGESLGRVRDFLFSPEDGRVTSIIIAALGYPQIPEQLISTYELSIEEVISSGPNRLIVFESAEDRLRQMSVGILEKIGIGKPPWEKEKEESYYPPIAPAENQIPSRIPLRTPISETLETAVPVADENWSDDDWDNSYNSPAPRQQAESIRYAEYEEDLEGDNWGGKANQEDPEYYQNSPAFAKDYSYDDYQDSNVEDDVWDDDVDTEPFEGPKINIPERKTSAEYYEDERGYPQ